MSTSRVEVAARPEFAVRRRSCRLQAGIARPFVTSYRMMLAGLGAGAGIALVGTYASHSVAFGAVIGLAVAGVAFAVSLVPFANPGLRSSLELINDHNRRERTEWRARTGTRVPVGIGPQERWLAANADPWGRPTVLLALGRLAEADEAIDRLDPATPEERFDVDLMRATRELFAGHRPDLAALHGSWQAIEDPALRRTRRQCLAIFGAMVAVADHADPIAALAGARDGAWPVAESSRIGLLFGRWLLVGAAPIVVAAVLGSALS